MDFIKLKKNDTMTIGELDGELRSYLKILNLNPVVRVDLETDAWHDNQYLIPEYCHYVGSPKNNIAFMRMSDEKNSAPLQFYGLIDLMDDIKVNGYSLDSEIYLVQDVLDDKSPCLTGVELVPDGLRGECAILLKFK